ncbi:MAG: hypothetical protein V3S29_11470 [bacterium]
METAIFCQMIHNPVLLDKLHYGRWKKGQNEGEVDFVFLDNRFRAAGCVEIKWSDRHMENPGLLKSLTYFLRKNRLRHSVVTTRSRTATKEVGGGTLHFVPSAGFAFLLGKNLVEGKETEIRGLLAQSEDGQLSFSVE